MTKIKYTFTLEHDKGTVKLFHVTYDGIIDIPKAIQAVTDYEKCPQRAIKSITINESLIK